MLWSFSNENERQKAIDVK